ncbi:MAG: ABC transporter permease subunit [Inquilinaceae bacterium]
MTQTVVQPGSRPILWLTWAAAARAWIFLAVLIIAFEVWARVVYDSSFLLNPFNVRAIAMAAVAPLLLGLGQTLVIISGGIDLSVGFTMGLAAVVMATVVQVAGPHMGPAMTLALGILVALAAVAVPGWINGMLISRLGVPPFIGTLGMYGVARGVGFLLADGTTVPARNEFLAALGNGKAFGVPIPILITIAIVVAFHLLLSQTRFGQYTYAVGGNRQAAIRAGINVRRHTLTLYILAALSAGASGILYTARFSAGAAQAGEPLLLDSIAAVVIGGASLFGGSGTIVGTVIGALIIAVIQFGLVFMNVEPFWQFVAVGVVIIISVLVDQSQRRLGGETRDDG